MRVIIVDDHQLLRSALRTFVEESFSDITTEVCKDVTTAIERLRQQPPIHLMLLDLGLPGEEGISALRRVRSQFPALDVIVITGNTDEAVETAVRREGAKGYVRKDHNTTELRRVIEYVIASQTNDASTIVTNKLGAHWTPNSTTVPLAGRTDSAKGVPFSSLPLTPRQRDVAVLLMAGKTSKEIALELGLAEQTVKQYSQVIFQLLGVRNRTLAAIKLREYYE